MNSFGNVFDSVTESVDSNKRNISDCQKTAQQCTQAQRMTEDKMTSELRTVRERSCRTPFLISKRDQCVTILCSLEYPRITVRTHGQFFRNFSNENVFSTTRYHSSDGMSSARVQSMGE